MEGGPETTPQLVAMVPKLRMVPTIVPQPESVALLEIVRPLANTWVPPTSWKVAALVPSPTTKGNALLTVVFRERSVPPLNVNRLALLVRRRLSVSKMPLLKVIVPLGRSARAEPLSFVTLNRLPTRDTFPVERPESPTTKLDDTRIVPPARVRLPLAVLVGTAATSRPRSWTVPLETVICPIPSRPTQME